MTNTRIYSWIMVAGTVAVFAIALLPSRPAYAVPQRESAIDVRTGVAADSYQTLKERPVMVSAIRDGAVVKQREVRFNSSAHFSPFRRGSTTSG